MSDTPDLFSGPVEDAQVRALVVPTDPAPAERKKDQVLAHHEKVRREWLDRVRRAMVALYRERERANREKFHRSLDVFVSADDASLFLERVGYEGDTRWLANVFVQPKGPWTKAGTIKSTRRNATLIPTWRLVEDVAQACGL